MHGERRDGPPEETPALRRGPVLLGLDRPVVAGFCVALGALGAVVLGIAVGSIATVLAYIALALFLALGLDPLVRMLERRGLPRGGGISIVFCAFCAIVLAVVVFVLPPVFAQVASFIDQVPQALAQITTSEWFLALDADQQRLLESAAEQTRAALDAPETLRAVGGGVLGVAFGLGSLISGTFIVVALTLYFLASLDAMKQALYALAPARSRSSLAEMTEHITASVGSALVGSIILSALNAAVVLVLHLMITLPFAALMAAIAFVITLVPLFGSVIFLVLGTVVALFTSPADALLFGLCYLVYIQVESYVVSPRVMNRAISIPAALVLIGALVGGSLMGVLGVLLALPVMASILLIVHEVVVPRQDLKV